VRPAPQGILSPVGSLGMTEIDRHTWDRLQQFLLLSQRRNTGSRSWKNSLRSYCSTLRKLQHPSFASLRDQQDITFQKPNAAEKVLHKHHYCHLSTHVQASPECYDCDKEYASRTASATFARHYHESRFRHRDFWTKSARSVQAFCRVDAASSIASPRQKPHSH
jgi:hypothetical protein